MAFEPDTLILTLPGIAFSNGEPLTSNDVIFTLKRHIHHGNSQSQHILRNIAYIEATSTRGLVIELRRPYPAFLKALSRDQLGILPVGWELDESAIEPFVGSGPYRILRQDGEWILSKSHRHNDAPHVEIETWKILFEPGDNDWTAVETADLIPFTMQESCRDVETTKDGASLRPLSKPVLSRFQSSIWVNPYGMAYRSDAKRNLGTKIVSELVSRTVRRNGLCAATGVIPDGVAGCLKDAPEVEYGSNEGVTDRDFCIAATKRDFLVLNSHEDIAFLEEKYGAHIRLEYITPLTLHLLKESPPDFVCVSFAGAFPDPEGFVAVVPSFLRADSSAVFRECHALFARAQQSPDEQTRRVLYEDLNRMLIQKGVFVPGWKHPAVQFCRPFLRSRSDNRNQIMSLKDYFFG